MALPMAQRKRRRRRSRATQGLRLKYFSFFIFRFLILLFRTARKIGRKAMGITEESAKAKSAHVMVVAATNFLWLDEALRRRLEKRI